MSAAQASTGYKSVSYAGNMSTYIFFGVVGAVGIVVLVILMLGCKARIKKFLEKKWM
jgi:hypothetical protein